KATFKDASLMAAAVMMLFAVLSHIAPAALVGIFTRDTAVIAVGVEYLRIVSWNYVASGLIFVASSMFQAMGNTMPSLIASAVRILLVAIPWISTADDLVPLGGGGARAARAGDVPLEPRIPRPVELRRAGGESRVI